MSGNSSEQVEADTTADVVETAAVATEASTSSGVEKSRSVEEVASMISQQQQISFAKSNENLLVSSFVSFFEPLIHNLDTHVQAVRYGLCHRNIFLD